MYSSHTVSHADTQEIHSKVHMQNRTTHCCEFDFFACLGALVVLSIFASLAVAASGHWNCLPSVKDFDLPAWIQAVGSVAAVFVAIYIGRRSANDAAAGASAHCYVMFQTFKKGINHAVYGAEDMDLNKIRDGLALIKDSQQLGSTIRFDLLKDKQVMSAGQARSSIALARELSEQFLNLTHKNHSDFDTLAKKLNRLLFSADEVNVFNSK